MSLYDAILKYETGKEEEIFNRLSQCLNPQTDEMQRVRRMSESLVKNTEERTRALLDATLKLGDAPLTGSYLDDVFSEVFPAFVEEERPEIFVDLKREETRRTIELYQRLFALERQENTYEGAVRKAFSTKYEYVVHLSAAHQRSFAKAYVAHLPKTSLTRMYSEVEEEVNLEHIERIFAD